MKWWEYLLLWLASLMLSALSFAFWMFNFITFLLIELTYPVIKAMGNEVNNANYGPIVFISVLYPLTLVPVHWLNYKVLRGNIWSYFLLLATLNIIMAFFVMYAHSYTPICYPNCVQK